MSRDLCARNSFPPGWKGKDHCNGCLLEPLLYVPKGMVSRQAYNQGHLAIILCPNFIGAALFRTLTLNSMKKLVERGKKLKYNKVSGYFMSNSHNTMRKSKYELHTHTQNFLAEHSNRKVECTAGRRLSIKTVKVLKRHMIK